MRAAGINRIYEPQGDILPTAEFVLSENAGHPMFYHTPDAPKAAVDNVWAAAER